MNFFKSLANDLACIFFINSRYNYFVPVLYCTYYKLAENLGLIFCCCCQKVVLAPSVVQ